VEVVLVSIRMPSLKVMNAPRDLTRAAGRVPGPSLPQ
jgi:hypothetical protein